MLSTGAMVRLGRVKGNSMIYMKPTNKKLQDRAVRMIMDHTACSREACEAALKQSGGDIATAIKMLEAK